MHIDIEEIKKIAERAGEEIMKYYKTDLGVTYKKGNKSSPLTKADLASNKIICEALKKYGWPILSEESADDKKRLNFEYVWIVDPLDGTMDFIERTGEFSIIMALVKNKRPIKGVMYEPALGRVSYAEEERGAYLEEGENVKKLEVSQETDFAKMKILLSRFHILEKEKAFIKKLGIGEQQTRGSVAKISVIAEGKAHVYINSSDKTSEWDTCAGALILREAGGKITDMDGNELTYNSEDPRHLNGYVASNGTKHKDIIEALKIIASKTI